tara:strand:+ start:342 stop:992 length:651 start_codon:yes stop_codon:yes gene_type:complete
MKEKMKNEVMSIFPTPVVKTSLGREFTKDETDVIQNIPMHKNPNKGMRNHGSVNLTLFDSHADILKDIKKFIEYHLKQYLKEIEGIDTNLAGLRTTQSWLNITKPGEYHNPHYHPNSYLSGVFYIQCLPKDSINFDNRTYGLYNNMKFPMKKPTIWNSTAAKVDVKEGDLLIFPSWMSHHVDRNETKNKERISLSFNTFPIGEMGNEYNATHLKLL